MAGTSLGSGAVGVDIPIALKFRLPPLQQRWLSASGVGSLRKRQEVRVEVPWRAGGAGVPFGTSGCSCR